MKQIFSLFPTLIYYNSLGSKVNRIHRELLLESLQIRQKDLHGKKWSAQNYPSGFTSYGSMDKLHLFSSTFAELEKMISIHVRKYAHQLDIDLRQGQLRMATCWVNIMGKNCAHSMHLHPLSVISGTYYLQVPARASQIKFEDPRLAQFMSSAPRKVSARQANQRFFSLKPKEKHLVLFESWTKHEVPASTIDRERISISFNYDWC